MTGRSFKDRWREHKHDIKAVSGRDKTRLSIHAWELKDSGTDFDVGWELVDRGATYNPTTKKCHVCLKEKYHIMYRRDGSTLNKRNEVFSRCRHMDQKRLTNVE